MIYVQYLTTLKSYCVLIKLIHLERADYDKHLKLSYSLERTDVCVCVLLLLNPPRGFPLVFGDLDVGGAGDGVSDPLLQRGLCHLRSAMLQRHRKQYQRNINTCRN